MDYENPPNNMITNVETIKQSILNHLYHNQAKFPEVATRNDYYLAVAYTVRDFLLHRWINTVKAYHQLQSRTVCYFSAEFLLGPHLGNNLINLGIYNEVKQSTSELGINLDEIINQEEEPGLGNGGLGRLAACFMDSLATLEIPAIGYGIRYEYGIFDQQILDGWQVEITDKWLQYGNPWEIPRPEISFTVKFGGKTEPYYDKEGTYHVNWIPQETVRGVAYDTPILGYKVGSASLLRLWKSEACESFDFRAFNTGDYYGAVEDKITSENISKVLYPNDEPLQGKKLRLQQQYFFVSCALQDMIRIHLQTAPDLSNFHLKYAVQLNDTHPSIAIVELMRLLVDEYKMDWNQAWDITQKTFAYTNHTLLPEALEKWTVKLFPDLLPRHLELIYEINHRFLKTVQKQYPHNSSLIERVSIIDESGERYIRMANLATVGSFAVNGVAKLHTELLKTDVLKDFYALWPEKFSNKTNGVTPRRWMVLSNPELSKLITQHIGDKWIIELDELKKLEPMVEDKEFCLQWDKTQHTAKSKLAEYIKKVTGLTVNPESMFDVQVKRIHEYKRQHLNVLHIVTLYNRIKNNPNLDIPPRTFIFGGKAAPGYYFAKLIIKLITSVAEVVNNDLSIGGLIKVVFLPDYNVTLGQKVYPSADLSEQISTAGKEASGTGNMKFAMNGALTIGTLDGANIEIREQVGSENFFLFGLTVEEIHQLRNQGYHPFEFYAKNLELKETLDKIKTGFFSKGDKLFAPLIDSLLYSDPYLLLADYASYVQCQEEVSRVYGNRDLWTRKSILNVARVGYFSSDRTIREYCRDIWQVQPVKVKI